MKNFILLLFLVPLVTMAQGRHPLSAKKLYNKASKAYGEGNTAEALSLFNQCVADDPTYAEAYLNISIIEFHQKNYSVALTHARNSWFYNKLHPRIYSQMGKCFFYLENYDSSAFYLTKAFEFGSNDEDDFIYLGKANMELEEYHLAATNFTGAINVNGNNPVSYNDRGNAYYSTAEYDKAEADYKKALELNPGSAGLYSNLANVELAKGDPEAALGYINEGIGKAANDKEKMELLILKGNYYHTQGDLEKAEAAYNEAYEMDNENPIILTNQASILIDQENYQGAFDKCNLALEIQPEMMEAYFNRGIANEMLRNIGDACIDWEQAFILGSEKAEEYLNSAICNE